MKKLGGLMARLEALEALEPSNDQDSMIMGCDVLCAVLHGVISEAEGVRQLELIGGHRAALPPGVLSNSPDLQAAIAAAIARMTPEQREADRLSAEARVQAYEQESAAKIAANPERYGDTYAVLVPDWVKRRMDTVLARVTAR